MQHPNFFVIGTQKGGTTWLYSMLEQHPEVFVPKTKELHFFNNKANFSKGIDCYLQNFADSDRFKAVGEFTPNYFWTSDIPTNDPKDWNSQIPNIIHELYPDMKLILSLRNPTERAISSYYQQIKKRRISPKSNIIDAVGKDDIYGIFSMGFYYDHLQRWLQFYKIDQFLILIYENDIVKNKEIALQKVFDFIGVDPTFQPSNPERKVYAKPSDLFMRVNYYSPFLAKAVMKIPIPAFQKNSLWNIPIRQSDIEYLNNLYAEQNQKLATFLGQSLPW